MPTFKAREVSRIVNTIYKAIIEQRLPAGTRLVETRLAETLNANRNHVRDALVELSYRNVVVIQTNKGACVAQPGKQEAREVFDARRIIETGLVRQAIDRIDSKGVRRLEKISAKEDEAIRKGSRPDMVRLSGEFHLEIARIADNDTLLKLLDELVARSSLIIGLYEAIADASCSADDHHELIRLIGERQHDAAAEFMGRHLDEIRNRLHLEEKPAKNLDLAEMLAAV